MEIRPTHLTLINGTGQANFEAKVARLLEEPDGWTAWEKLKQLRRTVIRAANTPLAAVQTNSETDSVQRDR